jgi:hypothetical protein
VVVVVVAAVVVMIAAAVVVVVDSEAAVVVAVAISVAANHSVNLSNRALRFSRVPGFLFSRSIFPGRVAAFMLLAYQSLGPHQENPLQAEGKNISAFTS